MAEHSQAVHEAFAEFYGALASAALGDALVLPPLGAGLVAVGLGAAVTEWHAGFLVLGLLGVWLLWLGVEQCRQYRSLRSDIDQHRQAIAELS